ncbi:hypothetical protein ACOME3_003871 [Neoechinorhynchus agilis]
MKEADILLQRTDPVQRAYARIVFRDLIYDKRWSDVNVAVYDQSVHLIGREPSTKIRRVIPVAQNNTFNFKQLCKFVESDGFDQDQCGVLLAIVDSGSCSVVYCEISGFDSSMVTESVSSGRLKPEK